jgi:hypothetical protein
MAPAVHASTQAGRSPRASRSSQNVHFSTTPFERVGKPRLVAAT